MATEIAKELQRERKVERQAERVDRLNEHTDASRRDIDEERAEERYEE